MACSRDCKKTGISAAASFIALAVMEFVVHGKLLLQVYQSAKYAHVWNPDPIMQKRMPVQMAGNLLFAIMFTLIYTRGYEDAKSPLGQGLRFGLLAGLLGPTVLAIHNYFVYPVSWHLAAAWAAAGLIECLVLGVIVSSIYRPAPEAPHDH
ncbi:MAG: hypothetical protein HY077_14910 [Elusimicrobia bacterium]|nr:hypothetical protein [Elusimicrobiota bacterium]